MNSEKQIDYSEFRDKPWKFIFFVAKQKKWFGIAAVVCVVLSGVLNTGIYLFSRNFTNAVSGPGVNAGEVYSLITFLLLIVFFRNALSRLSGFLTSWWVTDAEIFSARMAFDHLCFHSAGYFANRLSGKLQSKVYNISSAIERIIPIIIWNFLSVLMKLITSVAIVFWVNASVGWIFLFFIAASVIFSVSVSGKITAHSREHSGKSSEAKGVMVDVIGNILAVKQNTAIERELEIVGEYLDRYRRSYLKAWRYTDFVLLFGNILLILMIGVVLYAAVYFWQKGAVSAGDVVMIFTMLLTLFGDLEHLSMTLNSFMQKFGQLKEGLEDVFVPHEIVDDEGAKTVEIKEGDIEFNEVAFHYEEDEDKRVFDRLSLKIPHGQKIGLVGESGAGKSTFVSLLLRFMDVEKGKIEIDGHDIRDLRQDDLRRAIAYVPQEALLFHRSLKENIQYGNPEATDEDFLNASKSAHALEFIQKLPNKFDTLVGERGVKLSGGQKQRVMIARAMLKKSPILVLDEATSSLDSKSEKFIQEALEVLMKGRTTLVIAHRLSTLKKMDRIIVFDGGKIVEDGTHADLIAQKGKYYELWMHQSGGMV